MSTAPRWRPRQPIALLIAGFATVAAVSAFAAVELRASPVVTATSVDAAATSATVAPFSALPVGDHAPRLTLTEADSARSRVALPEASGLTLVSFLSTQPDTAETPSRSQAVELVSLAHQYASRGVHVLIVDESSAPAGLSELINTTYDWQLGILPLLADPGHAAAHLYGVSSVPTTLLIDRTGTVIGRWDGYALTAAVAQAVAAAL